MPTRINLPILSIRQIFTEKEIKKDALNATFFFNDVGKSIKLDIFER